MPGAGGGKRRHRHARTRCARRPAARLAGRTGAGPLPADAGSAATLFRLGQRPAGDQAAGVRAAGIAVARASATRRGRCNSRPCCRSARAGHHRRARLRPGGAGLAGCAFPARRPARCPLRQAARTAVSGGGAMCRAGGDVFLRLHRRRPDADRGLRPGAGGTGGRLRCGGRQRQGAWPCSTR